jgi:hypothetical protein
MQRKAGQDNENRNALELGHGDHGRPQRPWEATAGQGEILEATADHGTTGSHRRALEIGSYGRPRGPTDVTIGYGKREEILGDARHQASSRGQATTPRTAQKTQGLIRYKTDTIQQKKYV